MNRKRSTMKLFSWMFIVMQSVLITNAVAGTSVFWRAESPEAKTVYLFGTMHSDDNRVTTFKPSVMDALESVDAFMLEVGQPKSMQPLLTKDALQDDLSEAQMDQVNALADQYVISRDLAKQMKPWLLAVIFAAPKPQTPFGQDYVLMSKAEGMGKEIVPLETAEIHFGVMDDISREEQLDLLKAVLSRQQEEKEADFEKILVAYLSGDLDQILSVNDETTSSLVSSTTWDKMKARLITKRNREMATKVIEASKQQALFVAVGASHLAGESGLVTQLQQAGFALTPLTGLAISQ